MAYNSNIPQGTDPLLKSQAQIKANFQGINAIFAENHVQFNQEFQGKHVNLQLTEQTDPLTNSTQIAIYNKLVAGIPALFFAPSSNQTPIQLTYPSIQTGLQSATTYFPDQYTFLPGPFVLYAGLMTSYVSGTTKILSPTTTLIYAGTSTVNKLKVSFKNNVSISGSSFTVTFDGINKDIYYLAIGKP